jgi:hypothetical protein
LSTRTWTVGRSVFFTGAALAAAVLVDQIVGCMSAPAQARDRRNTVVLASDAVPATPDDLIVQMSQAAGVIFVGHVVQVRPPGTGFSGSLEAAAEGIVEVDFFVDQAVRGPGQGSVYTLREWGGLWAGGTGLYRIGQRLLVLLRASDSAGLSSPVHGTEGLIPLRGGGQPPGPDDGSSPASQWMVDIRWLQAQTLRSQIVFGVPGRGSIPIRGGRGPRSEAYSAIQPLALQNDAPLLVHALPGPWVKQEPLVAQAEPLSHVLTLCASSTGSQDASK